MIKKRVLFCIQDFKHGGIPKCLETLISLIDKDRFEVDIFCINQEGLYKEKLGQYSIFTQSLLMTFICANYRELKGGKKLVTQLIKVFRYAIIKIFGFDIFTYMLTRYALEISKMNYDTIIAFAEGTITRFVSEIECKNKVAWIHIDYKRYLFYEKSKIEDEFILYSKYNTVVSPSKFSANSFIDIHPILKNKIKAIPNLLDIDDILTRAKESELDQRFSTEIFTIISVGRICYEKQFFKIPEISAKLKNKNIEFRWYIIGGGSDVETEYLIDHINKYDVHNEVILLGSKNNPYKYIAKSNLLVSTSLSETFSYVINEAMVLGVPVVSTDFGSVTEVLDNSNGVILPIDCLDKGIIETIKKNKDISTFKYNNLNILNKIYDIF